jgi:hypothetical protein
MLPEAPVIKMAWLVLVFKAGLGFVMVLGFAVVPSFVVMLRFVSALNVVLARLLVGALASVAVVTVKIRQ